MCSVYGDTQPRVFDGAVPLRLVLLRHACGNESMRNKPRFIRLQRVHTSPDEYPESLLRELSGSRPLRRVVEVVDIVSKPRIWSRRAKAISLENWPTLEVMESGRTAILLLQPYYTLAFTSTRDCPVPLVYARWKSSEIEE